MSSWILFLVLVMLVGIYLSRQSRKAQEVDEDDDEDVSLEDLDDDTLIEVTVQPAITASMEISHSPYPIEVVGESHYREVLDDICGRPENRTSIEKPALLVPVAENPHSDFDKSPVRVIIEKKIVGYLDPGDALNYRERFGDTSLKCMANIRGGGWIHSGELRGNYGVWLTYDRFHHE